MSVHRMTEKVVDANDDYVFRGLKCVTSTSWLDLIGDPHHDTDTGIFKRNFCNCEIGKFYEFRL